MNFVYEQLRKVVISSPIFSWIFYFIARFANSSSKDEIQRRKHYSLFQYKELAEPIPNYPLSIIRDNCLYGISAAISSYFHQYDLKNNCIIEHGLILGSLVQKHTSYSHASTIITFSEYRKKMLRKRTSKKIIAIGPYISYVDDILSQDELISEKEKLGRVLLVFPSHSIDSVEAKFDINRLIEEIESRKHDFDTVLICLYWKDICLNKARLYEEKGYLVTTAGHSFDHFFLNRLRSIIGLSDITMSNNFGTHIGYCIVLGKPHYVMNQKVELAKLDSNYDRELSQRDNIDYQTYFEAKNEIVKGFNKYSTEITPDMTRIVEKYWGINKTS